MATDDVTIQIGATVDKLSSDVEQAKAKIESISESVGKVTEGAKGLLEAFGLAFSIDGLMKFIESMGELGLQTERTMAQLGLSADQVGNLSGIAKLTGTTLESLTMGIERMSLNIQRSTRDAFDPAAQGLKALGLRAKDLIGLPADQYFVRLADAVSKFNPSLNLTNALMAIGGRGVQQMLPSLLLGKERFEEFQRAIEATGAKLTDAQTHAFAGTHEQMTLLTMTVQGLGNAIFTQLGPTIDAIVTQMRGFIAEIRDSIKQGGAWSYVLEGLAGTLKIIAASFAGVAAMIRFLSVEAKAFWDTTEENGKEVGEKLRADLDKISNDMKATLKSLFGPTQLTVTPPPGSRRDTPALDAGGKDAMNAQLEAIKSRMKLADLAFTSESEHMTALARLGTITESQKTEALLVELSKRHAAELGAIAAEMAVQGQSKEAYAKLVREKEQKDQEYANKKRQLDDQLRQHEQQQWNSLAGSISGAFTGQLSSMLAGTESFAQGMQKAFASMVEQIIANLAKLAIELLVIKGLEAALGVGFLDSGLGQGIMAAFTGKMPAGLAGGGGGGSDFSVPKMDIGAWRIPADTLAMVHRDEMVVPSGPAQAFRAALSSSDGPGSSSSGIGALAEAIERSSARMDTRLAAIQTHTWTTKRLLEAKL